MAITDSIKDILSIKIKPRQDSYSDQFSRILMVKIMMIGTLLVGLNWYSDKMTCIIPGSAGIGGGFVSSACWINGLYVYKDVKSHDDVGYYGVPRDINHDGTMNGDVCSTTDTSHRIVEGCIPMEKTFYVQYQYMTFLLAAFAALYYAPYAIFRWNNQDMKSLSDSVTGDTSADVIADTYFNEHVNSKMKMRRRILGNLIVKSLYILVAVVGFAVTDRVLLGGFSTYGRDWINWTQEENSIAYDYMGKRTSPKPGDALLPPFGLCEVHESAQDIKHVITNKHRFVCELSQHILYQYVFIIIWCAMVASIFISSIGLLWQIVSHVITAMSFVKQGKGGMRIYKKLALRECEYLEFIRRKNMPLYRQVLEKLKTNRYYMSNGGEKKGYASDSYEI